MKMSLLQLEGKVIKRVTQMASDKYDDDGFLRLEFTDDTLCIIVSDYGGYTGFSLNEYPTRISVEYDVPGLKEW